MAFEGFGTGTFIAMGVAGLLLVFLCFFLPFVAGSWRRRQKQPVPTLPVPVRTAKGDYLPTYYDSYDAKHYNAMKTPEQFQDYPINPPLYHWHRRPSTRRPPIDHTLPSPPSYNVDFPSSGWPADEKREWSPPPTSASQEFANPPSYHWQGSRTPRGQWATTPSPTRGQWATMPPTPTYPAPIHTPLVRSPTRSTERSLARSNTSSTSRSLARSNTSSTSRSLARSHTGSSTRSAVRSPPAPHF